MPPTSPVRYGKTCDRCGAAITTRPGERALCGRCESDEELARAEWR